MSSVTRRRFLQAAGALSAAGMLAGGADLTVMVTVRLEAVTARLATVMFLPDVNDTLPTPALNLHPPGALRMSVLLVTLTGATAPSICRAALASTVTVVAPTPTGLPTGRPVLLARVRMPATIEVG